MKNSPFVKVSLDLGQDLLSVRVPLFPTYTKADLASSNANFCFPTTSSSPPISAIQPCQLKINRGPPQRLEFKSDSKHHQRTFFYLSWDVKSCGTIMKEGLEGVVEFLLPELAFAGEQGESSILSPFVST